MIVCLCNALREREIRSGVARGVATVDEVFSSFGCEARCRTCVPDIAEMIARERNPCAPPKAELRPPFRADGG